MCVILQTYISGNEFQSKRLVTALLTENKLVPQLAKYFQPHVAPCFVFVQLYEFVVGAVLEIDVATLTDSFVLLLCQVRNIVI